METNGVKIVTCTANFNVIESDIVTAVHSSVIMWKHHRIFRLYMCIQVYELLLLKVETTPIFEKLTKNKTL